MNVVTGSFDKCALDVARFNEGIDRRISALVDETEEIKARDTEDVDFDRLAAIEEEVNRLTASRAALEGAGTTPC